MSCIEDLPYSEKEKSLREIEDGLIKIHDGFRVEDTEFDFDFIIKRKKHVSYVEIKPLNIFIRDVPFGHGNRVEDFLLGWDMIQRDYKKEIIKLTPVSKLWDYSQDF